MTFIIVYLSFFIEFLAESGVVVRLISCMNFFLCRFLVFCIFCLKYIFFFFTYFIREIYFVFTGVLGSFYSALWWWIYDYLVWYDRFCLRLGQFKLFFYSFVNNLTRDKIRNYLRKVAGFVLLKLRNFLEVVEQKFFPTFFKFSIIIFFLVIFYFVFRDIIDSNFFFNFINLFVSLYMILLVYFVFAKSYSLFIDNFISLMYSNTERFKIIFRRSSRREALKGFLRGLLAILGSAYDSSRHKRYFIGVYLFY